MKVINPIIIIEIVLFTFMLNIEVITDNINPADIENRVQEIIPRQSILPNVNRRKQTSI